MLTRNNIQLCAKTISGIGYGWLVTRQYSCSSSSREMGASLALFLNAADTFTPSGKLSAATAHGCVKFARSASCHSPPQPEAANTAYMKTGRTGLPRVHSSQSRIPMTRFSVGWKTRLSSL